MKTLAEIIQSVIDFINQLYTERRIDTRIGTVLRNVIIAPIANAIYDLYVYVNNIANNQSIDTVSGDALDALASNWGIERRNPIPASGRVRFYKRPETNFNIFELTIPIGTQVYAGNLSFKTVNSLVFNNDTKIQEYDNNSPYKGWYYVEGTVICDIPGTIGNVGIGEINKINLNAIDAVDNPQAFTNGVDTQSDEDLRKYVKSIATGGVGTASGYKALILNNFNVKDVSVLAYNDPNALDNKISGTANIFVYLNQSSFLFQETFYGVRILRPKVLPLDYVDSIKVNGQLLSNDKYDIVKDVDSIYRGSYKENSNIVIHNDVNINSDTKIELSYYAFSQIKDMQDFIDMPENKILGSEVYIKKAMVKKLNISFSLKVFFGYDFDTVVINVKNQLYDYIGSLGLGDQIQKSDIVDQIYKVDGVDYVDLNNFLLEVSTDYRYQNFESKDYISLLDSEYFEINNININKI